MLTRWTSRHEEWAEDVGSVAVETEDGLVFVDPLEPPDDLGRPDHVLLTIYWHGRSAADLGAAHVWSSRRGARPLGNRGVRVTDDVEDGGLPGGIRAFATARTGEVVYWLPEQRAVVVGDVLLGAGAKPRPTDEALRLCPERWLGSRTHDDLRASLRPLLELPVEQVLVSHGRPVEQDGLAALRKVIGHTN
jgi:glyoxylase-like metal-dependent hydrolase (beta-lactamase superfamily II)